MEDNQDDIIDESSNDEPHKDELHEDEESPQTANDIAEEAPDEQSSSESPDSADQDEEDPQEVIGKLGDDLALARADLFNLRKEYTNYVRRAKEAASEHRERGHSEVLENLIAVLDDIHAARDAGDLEDGPFAAIADKLESILATNYEFERYGQVGEEFDPNLHDALMANDSDDVEVATIAQVLQPGYKKGDTVLRATKVIVDNPA